MCLGFPHVQRKATWSQPHPEKEPGTSRISTRSFAIIHGPQRRIQIIDPHQDTGFSRTCAETGTCGDTQRRPARGQRTSRQRAPRKEQRNRCSSESLHTHVHSPVLDRSGKAEAVQIGVKAQKEMQNVARPHRGLFLSHAKAQTRTRPATRMGPENTAPRGQNQTTRWMIPST